MSGNYQVFLSLSKPRPAITEEVEFTISIGTLGGFPDPLRVITPPKYTRVSIRQTGRGRLGLPREFEFDGATSVIRVRVRPQLAGALEIVATSTFRDPRPTVLRPKEVTGRLPALYIAPLLPMPAAAPRDRYPPVAAPAVARERWRNWHGNAVRDVLVTRPQGAAQIGAAIRAAEAAGQRVGVLGSGWSYSSCAVGADTQLALIPSAATPGLGADVIPLSLRSDLRADEEAYVHVPAALKVHQLNSLLAERGRAMPTLGGSRGQSIAGVLGTGVHGSDVNLPPIADAVCAIHLIGPGGLEWWIEPETDHITDPLAMQRRRDSARSSGYFCRQLRIVYDDDLFNAALVSMGCAGVVYAVVLKTVPAFELVTTTRELSWSQSRDYINQRIVRDRDLPRFTEINVIPATGACVLTERRVPAPGERIDVTPPSPPMDMGHVAVAAGLLGPAAFPLFFAAIGDYIRRVTENVAKNAWWDALVPGLGTYLAGKTAVEALDTLVEMHEALGRLSLAAIDPDDGENIARLLPVAVNLIWKIGFFVVEGKYIVDQFQQMMTGTIRPVGVQRAPSYVAMTGQPAYPAADTYSHPATERLVESFEYALPADRAVAFAERLRVVVDEQRRGPDALIVNLNMRFTRATRALLGMQQFDRTCHFEVYTFRGMDGNAAFHRRLFALAREFGAIPHWGQLHENTPDLGRLFGPRLATWQQAMNRLATGGIGTPDLFWTRFARERGLLTEPRFFFFRPDLTDLLHRRPLVGPLPVIPDPR